MDLPRVHIKGQWSKFGEFTACDNAIAIFKWLYVCIYSATNLLDLTRANSLRLPMIIAGLA